MISCTYELGLGFDPYSQFFYGFCRFLTNSDFLASRKAFFVEVALQFR